MSASRKDQVRVLIIDDSLVARSILTRLLDDAPDIEVVAAVGDIEQAAAILSGAQVDVVTLDLEMPGSDGLHYLPTLRRLDIPTICLSNRIGDDADLMGLLLLLGASACLNKVAAVGAPEELKRWVKKVASRQLSLTATQKQAMKNAMKKLAAEAAEYGIREDWQLVCQ